MSNFTFIIIIEMYDTSMQYHNHVIMQNIICFQDKNLMKFHANWQGKFSERIHGVIKLYVSSERNKWLKEAQAMLLLRKTEHPNIVKYLWVSRGKSIQFPTEKLSQEYRNLLTDANNRFVTISAINLCLSVSREPRPLPCKSFKIIVAP